MKEVSIKNNSTNKRQENQIEKINTLSSEICKDILKLLYKNSDYVYNTLCIGNIPVSDNVAKPIIDNYITENISTENNGYKKLTPIAKLGVKNFNKTIKTIQTDISECMKLCTINDIESMTTKLKDTFNRLGKFSIDMNISNKNKEGKTYLIVQINKNY